MLLITTFRYFQSIYNKNNKTTIKVYQDDYKQRKRES